MSDNNVTAGGEQVTVDGEDLTLEPIINLTTDAVRTITPPSNTRVVYPPTNTLTVSAP